MSTSSDPRAEPFVAASQEGGTAAADGDDQLSHVPEGQVKEGPTDAEHRTEQEEEDDEDDEEDDEDEVSLGFAVPCEEEGGLLRNQLPSKLGGQPAWLDPSHLPLQSEELKCLASGKPLRFLMQLYAPINDDPRAFHRSLYLFVSPEGKRLAEKGAVRAFRCQLPRRNAYYPYEAPESTERPRSLSEEASALALRRCPGFAQDVGGGAGKAKVTAPPVYDEHELVVEPEPEASDAADAAAADVQVKRLMEQYEAKRKEAESAAAAGVPPPAEDKTEMFSASPDPEVEDFTRFTARVSRAPEQCVRYTFAGDATPLWTSRRNQIASATVPACERCGARRRFEFQVMPQAITYLGVDSADDDAPDWATIAVFTCSASCATMPAPPAHGSLEDPPHADSPIARSLVGQRCQLSGLSGRADLNGTACFVLHWSSQSGRWAVECANGECVRVRSANLRRVPDAAAVGDQGGDDGDGAASLDVRDGGYAEEFVWVQPH
jgi:pre-rRNA-processing protein TSR4